MFDLSKVTRVYSGRKGCACGCRGKYTTAKAHQAYCSAERGYPVSDDECNDRVVKTMVSKIENLIRDPNANVEVMVDEDWIAVDMDGSDRTYTIYFWDEAQAAKNAAKASQSEHAQQLEAAGWLS